MTDQRVSYHLWNCRKSVFWLYRVGSHLVRYPQERRIGKSQSCRPGCPPAHLYTGAILRRGWLHVFAIRQHPVSQ